jgi:ribonucleoside-triphosphate reductase
MNLVRKIAENYKLPYYTISPTYSVCKNHGYLNGEQYECPVCGSKTEVYSRITGYYRPVQNWNDGKSEEYKERKTYDIANSKLRKEKECPCENCEKSEPTPLVVTENTLFTTKTCPNCKMAKMILDKAKVKYVVIDAEEDADLTHKMGVQKAPTLLVPTKNGVQVYDNASEIKRFVEGK